MKCFIRNSHFDLYYLYSSTNHDYVRDILLYIESNLNYKENQANKHKEITDGQLVCADCFENYDKQELTYAIQLIKSGRFSTILFT